MLFDVDADPHEQRDLADRHPEVVGRACRLLVDWEADQMRRSVSGVDPLWTVMAEGGGYYTRNRLRPYLKRLVETGRAEAADRVAAAHHIAPHPVGAAISETLAYRPWRCGG